MTSELNPATPEGGPPGDLLQRLQARNGAADIDHEGALVVDRAEWSAVARTLKTEHGLDFLANVTSVDFPDRFEVAYNVCSSSGGTPITVKVAADKADPVVPSVTAIWPGAGFQEREVYDLMGVRFEGHPDLKRILLWEGFDGHPLRKDWHEAYHEKDQKPFESRWPDGKFFYAEDELSQWGSNVKYPPNYLAEGLEAPEPEPPEPQVAVDRLEQVAGLDTDRLVVNMGPQHPSTHGVFHMRLVLDGERIVDLEPVMGYMHRNHEKIGERNLWLANMPYTDRLDYVAQMGNEWGYALAVEALLDAQVPERAEYIRIIMAELNRAQSHFWSIGFLLNDLGAFFTPSLYAIEERELVLDLFEMASGSRLMCNYMRFGGVAYDLPDEFLPLARTLVYDRLPKAIDEIDRFLTTNEVVQERMKDVGVLPAEKAIAYSSSGPLLRGSGVPYDIRRADPYGIYDRFDWDVVSYPEGDVYARYMVRLGELRQSVRILEQALRDLPEGEIMSGKKAWQLRVPEGHSYSRVENPRGELGYYCVSDGGSNPYRYHVRSPCFVNLTVLSELCKGHKVADVVAVLGSIDIILGEVDR